MIYIVFSVVFAICKRMQTRELNTGNIWKCFLSITKSMNRKKLVTPYGENERWQVGVQTNVLLNINGKVISKKNVELSDDNSR